MRRLVASPLAQLRSALGRLRNRFNGDLYYRAPFIISMVIGGLLVPVFMVMTATITPKGHFVATPQAFAASACVAGLPPPLISVRGRPPQVFYDGEPVGAEGPRPHLLHSAAWGPVPMVYLEGDRNLQVRDVYYVIDEVDRIDRHLTVALLTPSMRRDPCLIVRVRK
ncbi:MAG: hypothetical protein HYX28_04985 [Candidatus Koribacter versatilis]|uniref:Uncharacterized protein n=1 Tax=Candidatus Korobacter versatilis TaxID=658062 RepID=A0A932A9I7_9BACT|nr:hypothetical protein [Candidatus Koribacter versatilis]